MFQQSTQIREVTLYARKLIYFLFIHDQVYIDTL